MRPHDDPGHLDFVAMSAHKMYAPYGTGALVGLRDAFGPTPDHAGGGTVSAVTTDSVVWADLPDREEAGSPNVIGAVALAAATRALRQIGLDQIARPRARADSIRDRTPAPTCLASGSTARPAPRARPAKLGVIPFTVDGIDHALIAAVLGYEHGVGVRSGCFCAHPYIAHLLGLDEAASMAWVERVRQGDKRGAPGMVRISLGCYNDRSDVDVIVSALEQIIAGDIAGDYRPDIDGSYTPVGYVEPMLYSLDAPW